MQVYAEGISYIGDMTVNNLLFPYRNSSYIDYSCLGEEQGHGQPEGSPQRGDVEVNVEIMTHQVMENHQRLMYEQLNNPHNRDRHHQQQVQQVQQVLE